MTEDVPERAARAFDSHDAFVPEDGTHAVDTTVFDARVTARPAGDGIEYRVTVEVPTLSAATVDSVGQAVADGWFETLERRLTEAPKATRADLELSELAVDRGDATIAITFAFTWPDADRAVEIAKTLVEYVEGTYVEGIVPGYEYVPPVSDLLSAASQGDDQSGTPL